MKTLFEQLDYRLIDYIFIIAGIAGVFFLPESFVLAAFAFIFLIVLMLSSYFFQRFAERTKDMFKKIGDIKIAHLISGEKEMDVPIDNIKSGDVLIIKNGERVPVDGKISAGDAYINESFSAKEGGDRVFKQQNDFVYAGTLNEGASFTMVAKKEKNQGLLSQTMRSAKLAEKFKSRSCKVSDITVICAAVILIVLIGYIYSRDFVDGLAKIVALFFVFGAGRLAFFGKISAASVLYSLISVGAAVNKESILEQILRTRSLVLHKTERLVLSKKNIFSIISFWGADENKVLSLAASAHKYSHDIFSRIILEEAAKKNIKYDAPLKFEVIKGHGTKAYLPGNSIILAGSEEFIRMSNLHVQDSILQRIQEEKEQSRGEEQLFLVACDNKMMGAIFFKDTLQMTSKMAFEELRKAGVKRIVLVSEKKESDSQKIANYLGADQYLTDQSLKQRNELMMKMQKGGELPLFAGDGISDREMLSGKWIGAVVGAMENNLPADAADIVLLKNNLSLMPIVFGKAKKLTNILRINLLLCLAYHAAVAALILFGAFSAFEALAANLAFQFILMANTSRIVKE